jgi:hypothetical protein
VTAALTALGLLLIALNRVLAVDRGRHGRFRPHPFRRWRHTAVATRPASTLVPARPWHSRRGFAPAH